MSGVDAVLKQSMPARSVFERRAVVGGAAGLVASAGVGGAVLAGTGGDVSAGSIAGLGAGVLTGAAAALMVRAPRQMNPQVAKMFDGWYPVDARFGAADTQRWRQAVEVSGRPSPPAYYRLGGEEVYGRIEHRTASGPRPIFDRRDGTVIKVLPEPAAETATPSRHVDGRPDFTVRSVPVTERGVGGPPSFYEFGDEVRFGSLSLETPSRDLAYGPPFDPTGNPRRSLLFRAEPVPQPSPRPAE